MLILTNASPPMLRTVIAVSKTLSYEWHEVGSNGALSTNRGTISSEMYDSIITEWAKSSGQTSIVSAREQMVYVGASDSIHPPQVQRLLDRL